METEGTVFWIHFAEPGIGSSVNFQRPRNGLTQTQITSERLSVILAQAQTSPPFHAKRCFFAFDLNHFRGLGKSCQETRTGFVGQNASKKHTTVSPEAVLGGGLTREPPESVFGGGLTLSWSCSREKVDAVFGHGGGGFWLSTRRISLEGEFSRERRRGLYESRSIGGGYVALGTMSHPPGVRRCEGSLCHINFSLRARSPCGIRDWLARNSREAPLAVCLRV